MSAAAGGERVWSNGNLRVDFIRRPVSQASAKAFTASVGLPWRGYGRVTYGITGISAQSPHREVRCGRISSGCGPRATVECTTVGESWWGTAGGGELVGESWWRRVGSAWPALRAYPVAVPKARRRIWSRITRMPRAGDALGDPGRLDVNREQSRHRAAAVLASLWPTYVDRELQGRVFSRDGCIPT
jgi:hypothetical protein